MNWQTPVEHRVSHDIDPMTPRMSSGSGPIQSEHGLIHEIKQRPLFWGIAFSLTISGLLGMVTL